MSDINALPVHHILLGDGHQTVAAGTAPLFPDGGPTRINQYIDANKDGRVDYVELNRSSSAKKTPRSLKIRDTTHVRAISSPLRGWRGARKVDRR